MPVCVLNSIRCAIFEKLFYYNLARIIVLPMKYVFQLHICLVGFVKSMSQLQKNVVCLEKMDQYSNMQTEVCIYCRFILVQFLIRALLRQNAFSWISIPSRSSHNYGPMRSILYTKLTVHEIHWPLICIEAVVCL